jgi:hypothetical protein
LSRYVRLRRIFGPGRYTRRKQEQGTQDGPFDAMIYLKWTPSELATLRAGALYTEIDEDGWVQRELGIGDDGLITHQLVPCDAMPGWFGLARLSLVMLTSNVTKAEFESLWHAGSSRAAEQP